MQKLNCKWYRIKEECKGNYIFYLQVLWLSSRSLLFLSRLWLLYHHSASSCSWVTTHPELRGKSTWIIILIRIKCILCMEFIFSSWDTDIIFFKTLFCIGKLSNENHHCQIPSSFFFCDHSLYLPIFSLRIRLLFFHLWIVI